MNQDNSKKGTDDMKWDNLQKTVEKAATAVVHSVPEIIEAVGAAVKNSVKDPWGEFFQTVKESLAAWYAERNQLEAKEVLAQLDAYFESETPSQPQLKGWEEIGAIELEAQKVSASVVKYFLYIYARHEGKWSRITMSLDWPEAWENAPNAIRKEFIMSGESTLKRTLYPR